MPRQNCVAGDEAEEAGPQLGEGARGFSEGLGCHAGVGGTVVGDGLGRATRGVEQLRTSVGDCLKSDNFVTGGGFNRITTQNHKGWG